MRQGKRFVQVHSTLFALAVFWLLFVLAWRYLPGVGPFMNARMADLQSLGLPFHITSHDKTFLPLVRLLHVLALVYVVSCLPVVSRLSAHALAEPLRVMGRQGLLVFSIGALLSLAGQAVLAYFDGIPIVPWLFIPAGVVMLWASAWLADWKRRVGLPARGSLIQDDSARPVSVAK